MYLFFEAAAERLAAALECSADEVRGALAPPPKPEMGDIGYACFPLAKSRRMAPPKIAAELAERIPADEPFCEIRAVGPYLNFTVSREALARRTVEAIRREPAAWGRSDAGAGRSVVIDFSSPNIAKPLGVHHIRSTMLGAALARLYEATGWRVERVNHLGDWGTNFGQLMVAYKREEAKRPEVGVDIRSLLELYIRYHAAREEDASLEEEARSWFRKLEGRDPEAERLWALFVEESLRELKALYARLGVAFDHYTGESFFNDRMEGTVERIREAGLLQESEGALVVDLEAEGMPPCLIRKRDGATTYATRDLSAAEYRRDAFGFDRCLYVVAHQQELHFRQVFAVLGRMGYPWASGCEHVKFGMLAFGPGVFGTEAATGSTRKGKVVFLEEVLDKAVARAKEILLENAREEEVRAEADAIAEAVGVGAVVFSEFTQRRTKDVTFTWEKALNLQGDSGPYLQYTHARLSSVVRRYGRPLPQSIDGALLATDLEREVMAALASYPGAVLRAVEENEPSLVADYLLQLCAVFNRMFTDKERHRIVGEDEALSAARVALVDAVRITLAKGLGLLGLAAPERM